MIILLCRSVIGFPAITVAGLARNSLIFPPPSQPVISPRNDRTCSLAHRADGGSTPTPLRFRHSPSRLGVSVLRERVRQANKRTNSEYEKLPAWLPKHAPSMSMI